VKSLPLAVQLQSHHEKHGHLTEFAGFNLPLWFKGIIPESLAVRNAVGIFDVSHMGRALVTGSDSQQFLQYLTSNDVSSLADGRGQYSLLCNPEGGIRDDIIVFRLTSNQYLLVYNAANRTSNYRWFTSNIRGFKTEIEDISNQVALFAVQGPKAVGLVSEVANDTQLENLPRFGCTWAQIADSRVLLTRTGYTGEDGFEVHVWDSPVENAMHAEAVWKKLLETGRSVGIEQCGLGARDLLRLEAGLCLYGTDIDERTNPFEARLGFVVKLHKEFIGRKALEEAKKSGSMKLRVGLVMKNRVIPRHAFVISSHGEEVGAVTSGTLSPLVNKGIAMGYVIETSSKADSQVDIRIRERFEPAVIKKMPFYDTARFGYLRKDS
jgi:aminomethyltransferase